ncbi:hypothetical protein N7489_011657 [Penicillium chrysogenum]|uniref:uncharacterized protein n=1 Tax=Penicillium chrysogenum TaxID=5076 RepID=UPI0024DF303B|nr:uncharacterized protein N7489_011657 [Penicillium chrysogenum]KAJ5230949.1 hypothetical protein N7489_011657 [Penicillium chrysogenum]
MVSFLSHVSVVESSRVHLTSSDTALDMQQKDPGFARNSERYLRSRKQNHLLVGPSEQSM